MKLRIDLDGILLQLNIKDYEPSQQENWDQWCHVDFSFSSEGWLDYHKENDEVLMSFEVESLAAILKRLLNDEIAEIKEMSCIEPDFNFVFYPKKDLREDPRYTYVREGFEIVDIRMDWKISFWHEGLTANYLSVTLDRNDMQILLAYLNCVMGKLDKRDPLIEELILRGFILD